jgi:integrase
MRVSLTEIAIRNARPPEHGALSLWDASVPGLCLRVSQGGAKSFSLVQGSDRARTTIGRYPTTTLAAARATAKRIIAEKELGMRDAPAVKFEVALDEFFTTYSAQRHRASTAKELRRQLEKHFLPKLQGRKLREITTAVVNRILDSLLHKRSECLHAFRAIRLFFRWANRRGYLDADPVARIEAPSKERHRDRVLSDGELRTIWAAAEAYGTSYGIIIQLLILTGARRGEIGQLRPEYVDFETKTITLPASLTKNGRSHKLPICNMAVALLQAHLPKSGYFFPARRRSNPFTGYGSSKLVFDQRCAVTGWTLHDLRRTFATNLAAFGTPIHVTEKLLNHVSGSTGGIVAVYQRHAYADEMRAAVDAWEKRLILILGIQ